MSKHRDEAEKLAKVYNSLRAKFSRASSDDQRSFYAEQMRAIWQKILKLAEAEKADQEKARQAYEGKDTASTASSKKTEAKGKPEAESFEFRTPEQKRSDNVENLGSQADVNAQWREWTGPPEPRRPDQPKSTPETSRKEEKGPAFWGQVRENLDFARQNRKEWGLPKNPWAEFGRKFLGMGEASRTSGGLGGGRTDTSLGSADASGAVEDNTDAVEKLTKAVEKLVEKLTGAGGRTGAEMTQRTPAMKRGPAPQGGGGTPKKGGMQGFVNAMQGAQAFLRLFGK